MKRYLIASMFLIGSQLSLAEPFAYQKAVGSAELDPSIWEGPGQVVKRGAASEFEDSLSFVYAWANVDGRQPFAHEGPIEASGPTRISLYEAYRGTPEGTAYSDYYEAFPAESDQDVLVQENKQRDKDV